MGAGKSCKKSPLKSADDLMAAITGQRNLFKRRINPLLSRFT
jgi:hypothetical protein